MLIERVVSTLEMTSPAQLRPVAAGQIVLQAWDGPAADLAALHREIAAPHRWPSLTWSAAEWQRRLAAPDIQWQVFTLDDQVIGLLECQAQAGRQVEITIFGLRPMWQGRGLGAAALTLAIRSAWRGWNEPDRQVRRVWLHTSTRDGPRALSNYVRCGFTVVARETRTEELPDP